MSTAQKVIALAKSELGYHEGRTGSYWNNHQKYSPAVPGLEWSQGQAWCATFISWLALKAGLADLFPRTASTDLGAAWWKADGRWSAYPAVGAQGYLGINGDMYHTFLVTRFDDDYVWTVEGNTNDNGSSQGDGVYELRRPRRSSSIQGYGYARYPEGIVSADPAYRKSKPETPSKPVEPPKAPQPPTRGKEVDAALDHTRVAVERAGFKRKKTLIKVRRLLQSLPALNKVAKQ